MSVNDKIDWNDLDYIVEHVLPKQMMPNSIADRLFKQGREEGRVEGKAEGKDEGKAEGMHRGRIIGQILLLCELLSESCPDEEVLSSQSLDELTAQLNQLRSRL